MPLLRLLVFSVWFLLFANVQSKLPAENGLVFDNDVQSLFQRLILLEESLRVERERNDELERTVNSLVTNLEETKRTFEDKCSELEKQLQIHRESQASLSETHQGVPDESRKSGTIHKDKQSKISRWKPRNSAFKNHNSNGRPRVPNGLFSTNSQKRLLVQPSQVTPSTVAFYAQMSSSIPSSQATGNHVMVFDVVKTNASNGYHPTTGVFMVPESGIYVFSWSFKNGGSEYHSTELMVNNNEECTIHVHTGAGSSITGTGIAVLHVNKGDDVYVRISAKSFHGTIYNDFNGKSSFTGWQLP